MPFVYILRCSDGTLYVGHTDDVASREKTHNEGHGARCTAARRPVRVVYSDEYESTESAIRRECQLKHWTARKKEALIAGDLSILKSLSKRRRK